MSNGDIREGQWKDDELNGKGKTSLHKNGDTEIYEGEFENGLKHGIVNRIQKMTTNLFQFLIMMVNKSKLKNQF